MFQPAAAMVWAVARPMPRLEPAPVMTAVLSDTDMGLLLKVWKEARKVRRQVHFVRRRGRSGGLSDRQDSATRSSGAGNRGQTVAGSGSAGHGPWSACLVPPSSALTLATMASVDRP